MKAVKKVIPFICILMLLLTACESSTPQTQPAAPDTSAAGEQAASGDTDSKNSSDDAQNNDASAEETDSESDESNAANKADTTAAGKSLVIYFSREGEQYEVGVIEKGNTEIVAEAIAKQTGADIYELVPENDTYPTTYDELTDVAKQEQNDNARPAYAKTVPDLSQYDKIFIGSPVWWGDWPMIFYTFFENEDLSGKTLMPFCTHAGSGLSGFDSKLAGAEPDATVTDGLAIEGSTAQEDADTVNADVKAWLEELNLA